MNKDGYLLLADFGLAKKRENDDDDPNSFCGTPEYLCKAYNLLLTLLAPEMIRGEGHDYSLDWWTLGVMIYEMLVGIPPFFNKNQHHMF